jgi:hypothetical protein
LVSDLCSFSFSSIAAKGKVWTRAIDLQTYAKFSNYVLIIIITQILTILRFRVTLPPKSISLILDLNNNSAVKWLCPPVWIKKKVKILRTTSFAALCVGAL